MQPGPKSGVYSYLDPAQICFSKVVKVNILLNENQNLNYNLSDFFHLENKHVFLFYIFYFSSIINVYIYELKI